MTRMYYDIKTIFNDTREEYMTNWKKYNSD
jgi:hypothetical protein